MLDFILQLFGGRGAGSGNKGGHAPGGSAAGMTGSGKDGMLTIMDLIRSKKVFDIIDDALWDKTGALQHEIITATTKLMKSNRARPETIQFKDVNKTTRDVTISVGWDDGTTSTKVYNGRTQKKWRK